MKILTTSDFLYANSRLSQWCGWEYKSSGAWYSVTG